MDLANVFKLLSNPKQLLIVRQLALHQPMSRPQLLRVLRCTGSALSIRLPRLKAAGLVETDWNGDIAVWRISNSHVDFTRQVIELFGGKLGPTVASRVKIEHVDNDKDPAKPAKGKAETAVKAVKAVKLVAKPKSTKA